MKHRNIIKRLFNSLFILVFLLSMAGPSIVFAEDLPPAESPASEESSSPSSGDEASPPAEEQPPSEEPAVPPTGEEAAPPVEEQPAVVDPAAPPPGEEVVSPVGESTGDDADGDAPLVPEILEQIPDDTEIVVINSEGEVVPLASQEAAEIIPTSDPMWCLDGNWNTCYHDTTLEGLITQLTTANIIGAGQTGLSDGIMYFTPTYTGSLIFDNSATGNMSGLRSLTIYGGWDGLWNPTDWTGGAPNLIPDGKTTITNPLTVQNWTGNIAIDRFIGNIVIDGVTLTGAQGSTDLGVYVGGIDGDVTIQNVAGLESEEDAEGYRAGLLVTQIDGNVTVSDSHFDYFNHAGDFFYGNGGEFADVTGDLTIANTSFDNNKGAGLSIYTDSLPNLGFETITLSSVTADYNGDAGLFISHVGDVNISDSSVSGNNSRYYDTPNVIFDPGNVTITDSNFNNNGDYENEIYENGLVIDWGHWFDYSEEASYLGFDWADNLPGDLTVSGSQFNGNSDGGLKYDGFYYDEEAEEYWSYGDSTVVTIQDSEFSNNSDSSGLVLKGGGTAILEDIVSENNAWDNVQTRYFDSVSIDNLDTTSSACDGLYIEAADTVSLSNIFASDNGWYEECGGIYIENSGETSITDSESNYNAYYGVYVENNWEDVTLDNVEASWNGFWEGELFPDNYDANGIYFYGDDGGLTIKNSTINNNSENGLYSDYGYGLDITNSQFNNNLYRGATVYETDGDVQVSQSTFNNNERGGILISDIYGSVTISKITASDNGVLQQQQQSTSGSEPAPSASMATGLNIEYVNEDVSIKNSTFNNNGIGILIDTVGGNVEIESITANNNSKTGIYIYGVNGTTSLTCSTINNNGVFGVSIDTVGDVTLSGINPSGNGMFDLEVVSSDGTVTELEGCSVNQTPTAPIVPLPEPPGRIVPVNGGEQVPLTCGYSWTTLSLPNNDGATFGGVCGSEVDASLDSLVNGNLPGPLPEGLIYGSALVTNLSPTENGILAAGGYVQISFVVPADLQGKSLSIMFWDAANGQWIEVPSTLVDGKLTAMVNYTGTFVMVVK